MPSSYLVLAVTGILLVLVELAIRRWRHFPIDAHETAVSATVGTIWFATKAVGGATGLVAVYAWVFGRWAPWHLDVGNPLTWVAYLVVGDGAYYWVHRAEHRIPFLWASHVVHHSSEEFNLSTALRQTSTRFLLGWIFYLPMAVLGFPVLVFVVVGLIDLLYQYWIHTEQVGKLGWFDRVFASPSNHRVHHSVNDK